MMTVKSRRGGLSALRFTRMLRRHISLYPALYLPLRRARKPETVLSRDTELLIEGFPRSGNTWAEALTRHCSSDQIRLAHHSHAAGHVKYAVSLGVPALVLYRNPDDAVKSYLTLMNNHIDARDAYLDYAAFYNAVYPLRSPGVMFASFADVTGNAVCLIARLNEAFSLNLDASELRTKGGEQAIYQRMDQKAARLGRPGGKSDSRPGKGSEEVSRQRAIAERNIEHENVQTARRNAKAVYEMLRSEFTLASIAP